VVVAADEDEDEAELADETDEMIELGLIVAPAEAQREPMKVSAWVRLLPWQLVETQDPMSVWNFGLVQRQLMLLRPPEQTEESVVAMVRHGRTHGGAPLASEGALVVVVV